MLITDLSYYIMSIVFVDRLYGESKIGPDELSIYLDPDMLFMKTIPFKLFEEKADVFLLKRSFDLSNLMPTTFRELEYPDHKNKSLENVYPFIACFVILKNQNLLKLEA